MYPVIELNIDAIKFNLKKVRDILKSQGIDLLFVTKVVQGNSKIAKLAIEEGIEWIGESRINNIFNLRRSGIDIKIMQIRSPQISEVIRTVKYADAAVITEISVAKALSYYSTMFNKKFFVLIMVELGDLRDGVLPEHVLDFAKEIKRMKNLEILGIGTNLGCISGVIPTYEKMEKLLEIKEILEKHDINVPIVSGGATDTLILLENGMLKGINQLRIGEAIFLGTDTTNQRKIPYLRQDTALIRAEIIELKEKPSLPTGELGRDAFGNIPKFEDKGIRKRALLALGRDEIDPDSLIPIDNKIKIIGASSDHTVVDVTDSENKYNVGDTIEFIPLYPSLMRAIISKNIKKKIKNSKN